MMTRAEHLQWCKDRALEYVDRGDPKNALASMFSDLGKHPETQGHPAIQMGIMMMMGGMLDNPREFICGFN